MIAPWAFVLQLQAASWDALRELRTGDRVKVMDSAGQQYKGTFASLSDTSVSVQTDRGVVAVERGRVRRVQLRSNSRRVRNILIGTAVGVAVGVTVDQTLGAYLRNESSGNNRAVTYLAPIGLFGGIASIPAPYRTVYRAP